MSSTTNIGITGGSGSVTGSINLGNAGAAGSVNTQGQGAQVQVAAGVQSTATGSTALSANAGALAGVIVGTIAGFFILGVAVYLLVRIVESLRARKPLPMIPIMVVPATAAAGAAGQAYVMNPLAAQPQNAAGQQLHYYSTGFPARM